MTELHKSSYDSHQFEPNEGQRGLLCSNKESPSRCPSLSLNSQLSNESIMAMEELGGVLKTVYLRMKKDGYRIKNGVMVKEK